MKTYLTLITVAGLRRADTMRAREPIGEGEVIELPSGYAGSLLASGAIAPSDADVTVELDWDRPVELIKSNDPEGIKKALEVLGMDFANGPDRTAVHIGTVGIAPTDVQALAQALEAQGAIVVLQGEQWPVGKDRAWFEMALEALDAAVGVPLLLAEVARRVGTGEIVAECLPEAVLGLASQVLTAPPHDLGNAISQAIAEGAGSVSNSGTGQDNPSETAAPSDPPPVPPAPPKPVDKKAKPAVKTKP